MHIVAMLCHNGNAAGCGHATVRRICNLVPPMRILIRTALAQVPSPAHDVAEKVADDFLIAAPLSEVLWGNPARLQSGAASHSSAESSLMAENRADDPLIAAPLSEVLWGSLARLESTLRAFSVGGAAEHIEERERRRQLLERAAACKRRREQCARRHDRSRQSPITTSNG